MTDAARFDELLTTCEIRGPEAMLDELAAALALRGRWHGVFDVRIIQARLAVGLPPVGTSGDVPPHVREAFDTQSLAACREVGWPLLDAGQIAAGWMYLRAAADPAEVAARLAARGRPLLATAHRDDESDRVLQEILGVVLWDAADPALGIEIVLATQGTCNAITAYEQAVGRLPAIRQRPAAATLVAHLHGEVLAGLARDLAASGRASPAGTIPDLLEAGAGEVGLHVDVSHLQAVLRIALVCDDEPTIRRAWELARYACSLPADLRDPGEAPFTDVGEAARLFYGSQLGCDVDPAIRFFRARAIEAEPESAALPHDVLVLLLARLGRTAEALHAAVARPANASGMPSPLQAVAALPAIVDLAVEAGATGILLGACRDRGDEITFAATLAAERQKIQGTFGAQGLQLPQAAR